MIGIGGVIGSILLKPKRILYVVAAAAAVGAGIWLWDFVDDKHDAEMAVVRLEQELATMDAELSLRAAEIELMNWQREQSRKAAEAANAAIAQSEQRAEKYRALLNRLKESTNADDGPIAPALRDILDALGSLR